MILHRWVYDSAGRVWRCVRAVGLGDTGRCVGCGAVVSDEALYRFLGSEEAGVILSATLNWLVK